MVTKFKRLFIAAIISVGVLSFAACTDEGDDTKNGDTGTNGNENPQTEQVNVPALSTIASYCGLTPASAKSLAEEQGFIYVGSQEADGFSMALFRKITEKDTSAYIFGAVYNKVVAAMYAQSMPDAVITKDKLVEASEQAMDYMNGVELSDEDCEWSIEQIDGGLEFNDHELFIAFVNMTAPSDFVSAMENLYSVDGMQGSADGMQKGYFDDVIKSLVFDEDEENSSLTNVNATSWIFKAAINASGLTAKNPPLKLKKLLSNKRK